MLVRIPGHRIWVDILFKYDKYIQAGSEDELYYFLLRRGHVVSVHSDEEIQIQLNKTAESLKKDGMTTKKISEEISELYGIPISCIEDILFN